MPAGLLVLGGDLELVVDPALDMEMRVTTQWDAGTPRIFIDAMALVDFWDPGDQGGCRDLLRDIKLPQQLDDDREALDAKLIATEIA
ncbi:hypothetical protein NDU88_005328 [Pleurodeles waltl]|uniref:Uncharacterized protein n=1 Tax=Pleurodeles waltl TaxID=8319 RepID=A0AAV7TB06_PLEWA|nr:hypothetical protein NDU88_005328 [Pleurodeles waltl]